ncbi:Fc.00g042250.m01.CDS01 [Cosmosporella sp. VM-42]
MGRHANLFQALTEFYTVFVQLAVIPPTSLRIPDPINGMENFNVSAAIEAAFTLEAANLMARLPYLDLRDKDPEVEDWLRQGEGCFELHGPRTITISFVDRV